ncbi:unnamed protein product [Bodo saltans]|uniref:Uncharacterized protein n=1 Tax=Bodo saltans TaxID=75058 RepID=A0A0S4J8L3_BODSA|nr:unnamed protein product [Bodo saltans]|eukprot:CUG69538.1 unnamed protein product [Bodo saltans]
MVDIVNVSIVVTNGAVLPLLFSNLTSRIDSVAILLSGVRVGPLHNVIAFPWHTPSLSIFAVNPPPTLKFVARNISILIQNTTNTNQHNDAHLYWEVNINAVFVLSLANYGPADVSDVSITVRDSMCYVMI